MKCPECKENMTESNKNHNREELYVTRYFCFRCGKLYECVSQSGDMIEENLELLE